MFYYIKLFLVHLYCVFVYNFTPVYKITKCKHLFFTFIRITFVTTTFRNMNSRLEQFLAAENISQSQFADTINVARASVSHILAGRNKPGWDFLNSMMEHYPNLNIEWLMNGKGKMYKTMMVEKPQAAPTPEANPAPDLFSQPVVQEMPVQTPRESNIARTSAGRETNIEATKSQDSPAGPIQVIDNQRKISKIVVFYDDNTFIEIK